MKPLISRGFPFKIERRYAVVGSMGFDTRRFKTLKEAKAFIEELKQVWVKDE